MSARRSRLFELRTFQRPGSEPLIESGFQRQRSANVKVFTFRVSPAHPVVRSRQGRRLVWVSPFGLDTVWV